MASSESLSTSLRSSELRNLQQLVENPITEIGTTSTSTLTTITGGINITEGQRVTPLTLDLASSANTATNVLNLLTDQKELNSPEATKNVATTSSRSTTHMHTNLQPSTSSKIHKSTISESTQSSQQHR